MKQQTQRRSGRLAVLTVMAVIASLFAVTSVGAQDEQSRSRPWHSEYPPENGFDITGVRERGRTEFAGPFFDLVDDPGGEFVVLFGADILSVCTQPVPGTYRDGGVIFLAADRTFSVNLAGPGLPDVPTYVYETDLPAFEFFDQVCGGFFVNGTPMPAAFATGLSLVDGNQRGFDSPPWDFDTPPDGVSVTRVTGEVFGTDGQAYDLSAFGRVQFNGFTTPPQTLTSDISLTPVTG